MRKNLVWALALCAAVGLSSCKSRESAYRQAYEQAMAQDKPVQNEQQVVTNPVEERPVTVTPTTPPQETVVAENSARLSSTTAHTTR